MIFSFFFICQIGTAGHVTFLFLGNEYGPSSCLVVPSIYTLHSPRTSVSYAKALRSSSFSQGRIPPTLSGEKRRQG